MTTAQAPAQAPNLGSSLGRRGTAYRSPQRARGRGSDPRLVRALGWFSVGLGLAEITAPRQVARLIGVRDDPDRQAILRACGVRELASGLGILTRPQPAGWLWSRVGGDAIDLALLGSAMREPDARRGRLGLATAAVLGVTALDILSSTRMSRQADGAGTGERRPPVRVQRSFTVDCSPEDAYRFWHDFENLPRFMAHLASVRILGPNRSHWVARAPMGHVAWDAETTEDRPNELIAWRSVEGSDVENAGSVRFAPAPGDRGTEITVQVEYRPPAGRLGATVARLFGEEPSQQLKEDLRRFKQVLETGEVVRSEASPDEARLRQRPARPLPPQATL